MIKIDYIESLIEKFYYLEKSLEKEKVSEYLKSKNLTLDEKSLDDRIKKVKKKNGMDI